MSGRPPFDGSVSGAPDGDRAPYPPQQYPAQQPYPPQQPYPAQQYPPQQQPYPGASYQPGWPPGYPVVAAMPKPGSMPIGPNDLGATFGSTFGTLRALWKQILVAVAPAVGLTAILVATLGAVVARVGPTIGDRVEDVGSVGEFIDAVPQAVPVAIAGSLGYALIGAYALAVVAGTARAAGRAITGDRVPATFIIRSAGRALPRVLTWIGIVAVFVVGVAAFGLLAFLASSETSQRVAYIGIVVLVAAVVSVAAQVLFALKLSLLVPAMMLEPRSADPASGVVSAGPARALGLVQAARRSWKLTTGRVWRTFGITLLIGLAVGIAPAVLGEILNLGTSLSTGVVGGSAIYVVAYTLYFAVVVGLNLAAAMVQTIGQTVLYTDARIRDEGISQAILDHASTGSPADPWVRWHERY
jgi:hypothetical protein